MAGRSDRPSHETPDDESAVAARVEVRACPLCLAEITIVACAGPHRVSCDSCGFSCSFDVALAPPRAPEEESLPTAEETTEDVFRWLERPPGPILPSSDFIARQQAARRQQLALAGFVAASAAMAIALLSGYFGYHRASDELAVRQQTTQFEQSAAEQRLLDVTQRLERERQAAEIKRFTAEQNVRVVTAKYLAAQSQEIASVEPWRSVAISADAVRTTLDADGLFIAEAHQSLRDSLSRCSDSHDIDAIKLRGHAGAITTMAVSTDGRWLATGSADRTARLWDLGASQPQTSAATLNVHQKQVTSVLFTSDNRWLITGSRDATACAWSLGADAPASIPIVLPSKGQPISQMAVTPDGNWLAAVSTGEGAPQGAGQLWNLSAGPANAVSMELTGHVGQIKSIATSPGSRWLALGVDDSVKLWDLSTRDPAAASLERQCRHGQITATHFTRDGRWLVTCGDANDGAARLWNLASQDPTDSVVLEEINGPVRSAAISPDSRWLALIGDDHLVRLCDLSSAASGMKATNLAAGDDRLVAVAISAKGNWLAASDAAGQVYLWNIGAKGIERQAVVLDGGAKPIGNLAFTPDERWLAAAGDDWTVRLWNLNVGELAAEADSLAQLRMQAPASRPWSEQLHGALQALDVAELARISDAGIIWTSIRTQMPAIGPNWQAEMLARLRQAAEARVAEKPRDKELGSTSPAAELPSLTVAMPSTDPPKTPASAPRLKHEWPVRSIVKRPAPGDAPESESRTAAVPQSTLQIHIR